MMWDAHVGNGDAEIHVGQIQNALMRNARFCPRSACTRQDDRGAERDALSRRCVPGSRDGAAAGRARHLRPAYLNYTLGKLNDPEAARRLDRHARRTIGLEAFHDGFLSFGGPPIPLVRKAMGVGGDPL